MKRDEAVAILTEHLDQLRRDHGVRHLSLFGSVARDEAGPDSDADLLVVTRFSGSRRDRTVDMRVAVSGVGLPKDVFLVTPEEVERYGDIVGTIIRPALREGKVLYERSS